MIRQSNTDRFQQLSYKYGDLMREVWKEIGLDYDQLELSILNAIQQTYPSYREAKILDIGVGEGDSIVLLLEDGCKHLTGIDINEAMLEAARKRLGEDVRLLKADAMHMDDFTQGMFDIVITSGSIHNIPKEERSLFWSELLRLSPTLFVCAEKIADPDPVKYQKSYKNDIEAIQNVCGRHNLSLLAEDWAEHYRVDEREKLTVDEIMQNIGEVYVVRVFFEMGMCKTVLCIRKDFLTTR
ncbi:MAG TPA: class I SAM-dependent methyltransferase [Candidatus Andersenbacteria bacterium]|nr:class I SAM-dependent methyltransferase [Candidatus Andersenbacteria bacterium]